MREKKKKHQRKGCPTVTEKQRGHKVQSTQTRDTAGDFSPTGEKSASHLAMPQFLLQW